MDKTKEEMIRDEEKGDMTEEFNLSDKMMYHNSDFDKKYGLLNQHHVREAVRLLKEDLVGNYIFEYESDKESAFKIIDKIFGSKLI